MKRLNPETGKPFKVGECREDGYRFKCYIKNLKKDGFFYENWLSPEAHKNRIVAQRNITYDSKRTKAGHLKLYLASAKCRAKKANLPFDLTHEYLESIATDKCPIFGTPFVWGLNRTGYLRENASLDRIVPSLGYVKGNVVFISKIANTIKQDVTETELYAVADWLHDKRKEVLNAFKKQSASVPTKHIGESQGNSQFGTVHGAGPREDCDGANHHRGEPEGDDTCDSTQAGCRICMGARGKQVEALELYENCQDYGLTETETRRLAELFGCICHQP